MPAPAWNVAFASRNTIVRIGMLKSIAPVADTYPMAPQYTPRGARSSSAIISIARIFGAPVIEPPGNAARNRSNPSAPSRNTPVTVETRWCTVGCDSSANNVGTSTDPVRQTLPRSLRSRSTIITFSARSLGELRSASACAASSFGFTPRGAVPFMGRVSSLASRQSKNRRS